MFNIKEYRVIKIYSKELQKEKKIYLYLPQSYENSDKLYSVLYMHDGQNLFDEKIAYMNSSWNIIDSYHENPDMPEIIIVGIESDADRSDELSPYEFTYQNGKKAGGKADLYLSFIVSSVKPYIDQNFRTLNSPQNTGIMGSSFGGVNSTYAAFTYGSYFTRFGCVSNSYYFGGFFDRLKLMAKNSELHTVEKFYMDVGTTETESENTNQLYLETNNEMYEILKEKISKSHIQYNIIDGGVHIEFDWKKRFPEIIKFMFDD